MEKLIPMTDFVLEQDGKFNNYETELELQVIHNYARFIKQPLKLEMFVPCDEGGNVLEEPNPSSELYNTYSIVQTIFDERRYGNAVDEYQKAKEKVLFEGFYIHHNNLYYPNQVLFPLDSIGKESDWFNVEWLLNESYQDLKLTPTALKQIGI